VVTVDVHIETILKTLETRGSQEPVLSQESEQSCICVLKVSILPISTIFLLGFETVPTMWYFCCCSIYTIDVKPNKKQDFFLKA
jgi:hypothetical protein